MTWRNPARSLERQSPRKLEVELRGLLAKDSLTTRRIVAALRRVVRENASGTEESILWRGLSYHRPEVGGRVKGAVCQITWKRGRVRLEFIHGVRLADPHGLLRGACVSKRSMAIESTGDAARPEVAALIRLAAALDIRR
jgi:hypothetical protein